MTKSLTEKYSIYYQLLVSLHGCSQRAPRLSAQGIVDSPFCDFHLVKKRNDLILNINRLFSQALRFTSVGWVPRGFNPLISGADRATAELEDALLSHSQCFNPLISGADRATPNQHLHSS